MRSIPSEVNPPAEPTALDRIHDLVEEIREAERRVAVVRAEQATLIAELDRHIPAFFPDAAREELMVACRLTQHQARRRLETARALDGRLEHTRHALAEGRISFEHAAEMADATRNLGRSMAALVETEVLDDPRAVTPGQLGWRAREAAARLVPPDPTQPEVREPVRSLNAFWHPDGAVDFAAHLPAADAAVIATWVDATSVRQGPDDLRLATERRADALLDLIRQALDTGALPAAGDGRRPHVEIVAELDRLAQHASGTVLVDGRPIPGGLLRELVCEPDLRVTALSGEKVVDQGRTHRLVTPALRGRLAVRDAHCRFPGCTVTARSCRAHHIRHWADGGRTDLQNLILLCERHHKAVHGGWQVRLDDRDDAHWTTPAGQHVDQPGDLARIAEPEDLADDEFAGLPHPDRWIRPWWEFFSLERAPDPPQPSAPPVEPDDGTCPF